MYEDHFGLRETPFSIAPDPRFLFLSERHREALAHLLYGIRSTGGFVLVTGEVGTGKTTVCRCLLEQLPEQTRVAYIINPRLSALELLATICDELGIAYPKEKPGHKALVDSLNGYLIESHALGRQTVLIIDEAQNLTPDVLEQIRLLTNLETNRRKLLQIIMLGQPELRTLLARPELRQLAQRITARYHLGPLSAAETVAYIQHRLAVAGVRQKLFSPRLARRIHRLTGGVPRRINILCDRALLGAYVQGLDRVAGRTLRQAARELSPDRPWSAIPLGRPLLLGSVVAALALAPALLEQNASEPPPVVAAPASLPVVPPAAPAPVAVPPVPAADPPALLEWPADLSRDRSREEAYRHLLASWGLSYAAEENGSACHFAEENGLACLYRRGSLGSLRLLDRPAVLTLKEEGEEDFHAVLTSLTDETATFVIAGRDLAVPVRQLEERWLGEFALLWRLPPFKGLVNPGDRGPAVDWLNRQLAIVQRQSELPPGKPLAGEALARLKTFQKSRGLDPDGIVGPNTLIHLDTALESGSPRLAGREP